MKFGLVIIGVILAINALLFILSLIDRIRLRRQVRQQWGQAKPTSRFDSETSLAESFELSRAFQEKDSEVDLWTWEDLAGYQVFEKINHTYSSIGAEVLYERLRRFHFSDTESQQLEQDIAFFEEHPAEREACELVCASLGKQANNFVLHYLQQTDGKQLGSLRLFIALGCLPVIGLVGITLVPSIGLAITLGSICFNMMYYMQKKTKVEIELTAMNYMVRMIGTAKQLTKLNQPYQVEMKHQLQPIKKILRVGFCFRVKGFSEAEMMFDYLNSLFLIPLIAYHFVLFHIQHHRHNILVLRQRIGDLETALSVLNYRLVYPDYCLPTLTKEDDLAFTAQEMAHPLLLDGVKNPVAWHQNTLVTGSNASGKSTYVRAIALNALLAQTIHTVMASSCQLSYGHIYSSMAISDNLSAGESYFIAEIKSIKRVLDVVETGAPCYCFIDEILRGTNTIERIAASASIVRWLSAYQALALIATHDSELTTILVNYCHNLHFNEQVTKEAGIHFDYRVKTGPATSRNALRLLDVMQYPVAIVQQATAEAEEFTTQHSWKIFATQSK